MVEGAPSGSFADAHALAGEVLAEPDVVVGQTPELELGHRLLLRDVSAAAWAETHLRPS